jgi:MFS transporter, DHA2 family, multidrug resistance protein
MGLLLIVGPRLLPEYRDPEAGRPDLISVALSLIAVLTVIYGLKLIAQDGLGTIPVVSIVGGLAVGGVFVRRQQLLADPLIDLHLFRVPAFNGTLAANTLGFFVNFGIAVFIAQYLQLVIGLSPFEAGLWTLPYACSFVVGAMLTPLLVRRVPPAYAMAGGLVVTAIGFLLLTQVDGDSSLATLVSGSVVFALGLAPLYTLAADLMVGAAPPERAGAAAGISETSSEFGGALGIATLGAVGTAVYRGQIDQGLPAGAPPEAVEAARDTLGAAVAAGEDLPAELAPQLVDAAQEAFTQAFQVVAALNAAVAIAAAVLAVTFVRRVRMRAEPEEVEGLEPAPGVIGVRPC